MRIIINNSSMQPIYEQLVSQIRSMILDGGLKEEAPLPSVRSLATELRISALTVKKAYDILEQEGLVSTIHGKGSFVAHTNAELLMEERRKKIEHHLEDAINEGRSSGMKDEEIREMFNIILEDK